MSVELGFTVILPSIYLSFLRHLPSELAERNSTKTCHMLGSKCDLKMHVRNLGYTLPRQIGPQKPSFSMTQQRNSNFNGLYLPNKTRCRQSVKCVDDYKGSPTRGSPLSRPKTTRTLVYKQLQIGPPLLPTLYIIPVFYFTARLRRYAD